MNAAVFSVFGAAVYGDALLLAFSALIFLLMGCALYTANGGSWGAAAVLMPLDFLFSLLCARILYWYCHMEKFASLGAALKSFDLGGFSLPGVLLGTALAALLLRLLRLERRTGLLLDCLAPGAALSFTVLRLSHFFNSACRGKMLYTDPAKQHLPVSTGLPTAAGGMEFRFATFFAEALLFLAAFLILLYLFSRRGRRKMLDGGGTDGSVAAAFVLLWGAAEIVTDSTRYDALFFPFNAFISMVQIIAAVFILALAVYFSVRAIRGSGFRPRYALLWVLFFAGLGSTGYLEYLVQRHGNWYVKCYNLMSLACLAAIAAVWLLFRSASVPCGQTPAGSEPAES